ncbi:glycine receptor subunit alpha-2 [Folsomia candida]|uniref:glycine receptor subunit alpha-2 n=1 Tax=Folsomia candida TaxID=158441 RepID=UPI0016051A2D|nr:glycine receptor subunit alpha-2 [Folsomia candida]
MMRPRLVLTFPCLIIRLLFIFVAIIVILATAVQLSDIGLTENSGVDPLSSNFTGGHGGDDDFDTFRDDFEKPMLFSDLIPNPRLYDKMRPPKIDNKPTKIGFHVTVMGLDSIDEYSMTYAADIFFAQKWRDNRLRLPGNMTTEYRLLEVDWLQKMWRPDSFFKNAKQVTFQTMTVPNHYLWLYKDKSILYMVKLTLTLSCAMNFVMYPHDTQECKLQMESLSHTTADLVFEWEEVLPLAVDQIELPQLQLVTNRIQDCTQVYSTGNFTCLEIVFVLKRRLGYYLFHTYLPTCLIVIISWVSFWIQPEAAPARVTLGVTSILTLSTQHAKSQAALPPVSYLKAIDLFMSACTIFVFMALMEYCLVNILLGDTFDDPPPTRRNRHRPRVYNLRPQLRTAPAAVTVNMTNLQQNQNEDDKIDSNTTNTNTNTNTATIDMEPMNYEIPPPPPPPTSKPPKDANCIHAERRRRALAVDRISRFFFPLTFTFVNVLYWFRFASYL